MTFSKIKKDTWKKSKRSLIVRRPPQPAPEEIISKKVRQKENTHDDVHGISVQVRGGSGHTTMASSSKQD